MVYALGNQPWSQTKEIRVFRHVKRWRVGATGSQGLSSQEPLASSTVSMCDTSLDRTQGLFRGAIKKFTARAQTFLSNTWLSCHKVVTRLLLSYLVSTV